MRTPLDTWLIERVADGAEDDPRYDLRALCRHQVLPRGVDVWLLDFAAVAGPGEQTFRRHDWVVSADTGRRNRSWGRPRRFVERVEKPQKTVKNNWQWPRSRKREL